MDSIFPMIQGYVKIVDKTSGEVLVDKSNSVHYENTSEALALALANQSNGHIHEMVFGNGGTTVSGTGVITYFPPNVTGSTAQLYHQTFRKVVDAFSPLNFDTDNDFMVVQHVSGRLFSDVIVTCTLGFSEPSGQEAFDTTSGTESLYIFDELGLKAFNPIVGTGKLLTHVVFSPVQKSINRLIEITYSLRISMS